MSSYPSEESDLYNDIYYNEEISQKNVDELKENLLPYNIKELFFFDYYKYIAIENEEKKSKSEKDKSWKLIKILWIYRKMNKLN